MKKNIAGRDIEVNEEGYLLNPVDWDQAIASELAKEEGIESLSDNHWKLIQYLLDQQSKGTALTIRGIVKSGVVSVKEFYDLFPGGPLKKASKIAGITKPVGCI